MSWLSTVTGKLFLEVGKAPFVLLNSDDGRGREAGFEGENSLDSALNFCEYQKKDKIVRNRASSAAAEGTESMHCNGERRVQECLNTLAQNTNYLDTFYDILLARSPSARESFRGRDLGEQKRRLARALPRVLAMADVAPDSEEARLAQEEHAKRHGGEGRLNYSVWIDCLCETCRHHDSEFNIALEEALRERLSQAVRAINPTAQL